MIEVDYQLMKKKKRNNCKDNFEDIFEIAAKEH